MNMPDSTVADSARTHTERVKRHKDGSLLLSIDADRVCKLNGVGALTWMTLESVPAGLALDEIVRALEDQFAAINAEGELLFAVSRQQLRVDTVRFLRKMTDLKLLRVVGDSRGKQERYAIKDDVTATSSAQPAALAEAFGEAKFDCVGSEIGFSKRETLSAFIGLLAFDLLLKIKGFQSLIRRVESWPIADPRRTDPEICKRVRGMVDRAQMYYPKKAMCLQHSAVVTCLLRRRGVPAEMVLAAQAFPPRAHAWTEVMNQVVSDSPRVKLKYKELRRL